MILETLLYARHRGAFLITLPSCVYGTFPYRTARHKKKLLYFAEDTLTATHMKKAVNMNGLIQSITLTRKGYSREDNACKDNYSVYIYKKRLTVSTEK